MPERRRAKRKTISYYIQVIDPVSHKALGNLADVSQVGIMIDGRQPMPVGQDIRIRLDITPEIANVLHIEFIARVKWCRQDVSSPGIYDIGMELVNITPANTEILARIAETYGTRETPFHF